MRSRIFRFVPVQGERVFFKSESRVFFLQNFFSRTNRNSKIFAVNICIVIYRLIFISLKWSGAKGPEPLAGVQCLRKTIDT